MEPWIQPTTAPQQPDLADEDESAAEAPPRIERGWMELPRTSAQAWRLQSSSSFAITAFTAAVVIGFVFFTLVLFPLMLLASYGS